MSGSGEVRPTKAGAEGSGPWNKNQNNVKNVRPPKGSGEGSQNPNRQPGPGNAEEEKGEGDAAQGQGAPSTLNVDAAEFVPRWQPPPQPPASLFVNPEDMSYLSEAMDVLTMNPGRYQEFLPPIEDITESALADEKAVSQLIDLLLEHCIKEANFRYSGARLCRDLFNKFGLPFINCLLSRCKEQFAQLAGWIETNHTRACGFAMTLAELYRQITIDRSLHIHVLALNVRETLDMFLVMPTYEFIRCVCQVIKLCIVVLESEGVTLQPVFVRLEELLARPDNDANTKCMISNLLFMRRTEWNTPAAPAPVSVPFAEVATDSYVSQQHPEGVFYSPDGQVMSEEERNFLIENVPISEDLDDYILDNGADDGGMDDEICEAYEEFMTFANSNNKRPPNNSYNRR